MKSTGRLTDLKSRRDLLYLVLGAFFITNALVAEIIGGKLFALGPFTLSIGVLPWPVVFIMTDLVNEYFGKEGVRRLTFVTVGMILFAFALIFMAMQIPAVDFSPISDASFHAVFRQSLWIIVGSLTAFLISQLVDVTVFWFFRNRTGMSKLWLRSTGSTAVSQLVDTFIVLGIAFWLPGILRDQMGLFTEQLKDASVFTTTQFFTVALSNYTYKFSIALLMTPVIYGSHAAIDKFLGADEKWD